MKEMTDGNEPSSLLLCSITKAASTCQEKEERVSKQLSIPGLPAPELKPKLVPEQVQLGLRLNSIECRLLKLELEVSLLRILMEKGERVTNQE